MPLPPALTRIVPDDFTLTTPIAALLTANFITIILAIVEGWNLADVLFIYWAQSIIIGGFTVISIISADTATIVADGGEYRTGDGISHPITRRTVRYLKLGLAGFFILHYGAFHWGYYTFIVESGIFGPVNFANTGIWVSCGLFFANHLYSFFYFRARERQGAEFITEQFFRPYNRIIPMHLTIIFGGIIILFLQFLGITTVMPVLILFLLLKTRSDITTHLMKHREETNPGQPVELIGF